MVVLKFDIGKNVVILNISIKECIFAEIIAIYMRRKSVCFYNEIRTNRAKKLFKRKIISQKKKIALRKKMQGIPSGIIGKYNNLKYTYFDYVKIQAPQIFSLIKNEEEVLGFIRQIRSCFEHKRKFFVMLSSVKEISNDAILILLSNMIQFKSHRIDFNGDFPINKQAKQKIESSGFFEYLYDTFKVEETYQIKTMNSSIYTHAQLAVAPDIADLLIKQASKTIWGEPRRCPGVQRTFIELMHNTNNHASTGECKKHWWLSVTHDKINKKVCFSFIDFGVGIFRSLDEKKPGDRFYGWKLIFQKIFPWADSNDKQLKIILDGELHKTVTKDYFRGKGLPGIKEALDSNKISSLVIISNNVYADVSSGDYHLLGNELLGTFVSWEINENIINWSWE